MSDTTCKAELPETELFNGPCRFDRFEGEEFCVYHLPRHKWEDPIYLARTNLLELAGRDFVKCTTAAHDGHSISLDFRNWVFPAESCKIIADLPARHIRSADFSKAIFLADFLMHLNVATKGAVLFNDTNFFGKSDFYQIRPEKDCIIEFQRAKFYGDSSFNGVYFGEVAKADLSSSIFLESATFISARFNNPRFASTIFNKGADFTGAQMNGEVVFTKARFENENKTIFASTNFHGETSFDFAVFASHVEMGDCIFNRPSTFLRAKFSEVPKFTSKSDINQVTFERAEFGHGDEASYRRIKKAMESQGNTWEATRFFGEELWLQRKSVLSLNVMYWLFNDYGRSWKRPLAWLFVVWLVMGVSYWYFDGFILIENDKPATLKKSIQYLPKIFHGIVYSFQNFKLSWLFGGNLFEPSGILSWIFSIVQSIFSVVMIALSVLTIRRRFKI